MGEARRAGWQRAARLANGEPDILRQNVKENEMRENQLRKLLRAGKPSVGTRLQSTWPTVTELVGRSQKFDYVEFLAEYAPYDLYAPR